MLCALATSQDTQRDRRGKATLEMSVFPRGESRMTQAAAECETYNQHHGTRQKQFNPGKA